MVAQTFGQLPSTLLRAQAPELWWLSPLDWHVFNVTAAWRYLDIQRQAHEAAKEEMEAQQGNAPRRARDGSAKSSATRGAAALDDDLRPPPGRAVRENAAGVGIVGTEIPPWER